jgi:hypothetical protein
MELGTTGAILTYALQLERQLHSFYEFIQDKSFTEKLKEVIESFQKTQRKGEKILQRLLRENITEMILEPIHDFDSKEYSLSLESSNIKSEEELIFLLKRIQNILHLFFQKAAEKTSFLPNVSSTFNRLAEGALNNLSQLV